MKINKIADKIPNIIKYVYRKPKHLFIHLFSCLAKKMDIERMNKIVVISPHPDDEVFGCAMLMNKLAEQGKEIYLAILSKGEYVVNEADAEEYKAENVKICYMMNYSLDYLYVQSGELSFRIWLRDFLRTRCFINFSLRDPMPTVKYYLSKIFHR